MLKNKFLIVSIIVIASLNQDAIAMSNQEKANYLDRIIDSEESCLSDAHIKKFGRYENYEALAVNFCNRMESAAGQDFDDAFRLVEAQNTKMSYTTRKELSYDYLQMSFKAARLCANTLRSTASVEQNLSSQDLSSSKK
jgi:hypothetical protein